MCVCVYASFFKHVAQWMYYCISDSKLTKPDCFGSTTTFLWHCWAWCDGPLYSIHVQYIIWVRIKCVYLCTLQGPTDWILYHGVFLPILSIPLVYDTLNYSSTSISMFWHESCSHLGESTMDHLRGFKTIHCSPKCNRRGGLANSIRKWLGRIHAWKQNVICRLKWKV